MATGRKNLLNTVVALHPGVTDVESGLTVEPTKGAADQADTADVLAAALTRQALTVELQVRSRPVSKKGARRLPEP